MDCSLIFLASTAESAESGLLGSLGVDVQLLVLQSIAFLLLLFILKKYVFPVLTGILEKREAQIAESLRAATDSEKNAEEAKAEVSKLLKQARNEADEIVSNTKTEASAMIEKADKKSRERAETIVKDAEAQIAHDIADARTVLRRETLDLVAEATEKVIGKTVDVKLDKKIIESALHEAEK